MAAPRIIAGSARGVRLKSVPGDGTRPITDRAKESLFNILRPDLAGGAFLDLFAGTGSVGIEALSQGAGFARLLDNSRAAVETIYSNLITTKLQARGEVRQTDSFAYLAMPPDRPFDYAFIAPPQFHDLWTRALLALDANPGWLVEDAWVIVQIDPTEYAAVELQNLAEFDQRKYGNVLLVFYEKLQSETVD
ncbi:MAG: 16S rRNA (guanine(966)-N(2))-methyltransferase RsmD [Anaerolineales bacterium]|jgi:16S rRNA (guanine(966)-N(2))-methyltransferase RsmD|nr:16S rRNA (guanine(966)-N(2))-methyltransferase RsmD [Anaerolineales bacterium]MBX3004496.1 16S rRNA (guanine(966)-N(2))-methyltransferase RsmD [Anaerolineales bacterium]MCW5839587.1 16S rRNA (guanine(966)-N(2))-methyltransferase RsmD [Anaerolineales bacterium]MCW5887968.1 16S rRNA (guanine(966)-N(2))-methyltransferase RsmD [Anaerolineales bacterium]